MRAIVDDCDVLPNTFEHWARISEARFADLALQNEQIQNVMVELDALI